MITRVYLTLASRAALGQITPQAVAAPGANGRPRETKFT